MENDIPNAVNPVGMAISVSLPPPSLFDPTSDPTNVAQRWRKWKSGLQFFIDATGMSLDSQKRATLLHLVGEETREIFQTFADAGTTYPEAIARLDQHFTPKKNVTYERNSFRKAKQESDETVDQFCTRLRQLALYCEYENIDTELRDMIVSNCKSSKLRTRLLMESDLTLDKSLAMARAMGQANQQRKDIKGSSRVPKERVDRIDH